MKLKLSSRFAFGLFVGAVGLTLSSVLVLTSAWAQGVPTQSDNNRPADTKAPASNASEAIQRGRYVALAADCVACHTVPKSDKAFAGGYALETPFGKLLASNITPDKETGIGNWTEADFDRALRQGKGKNGEYLYPAMPYTSYAKMSDQDVHDLWAYMKSVPPVHNPVVSNQLPFPFNIRLMMFGWNMLFFDDARFKPSASQSMEYNRGAYLVDSLGHCSACHTAKNFLGGDVRNGYLEGGPLQGWYAPNITGNTNSAIHDWSNADITAYLKTGGNAHAVASGPMAEAVSNSTQHLNDADLTAIAVYLKSVHGGQDVPKAAQTAVPANYDVGRKVFEAQCSACHRSNGQGVSGMITPFAGNKALLTGNTDTLLRTVLLGGRGAVTQTNPTGAAMPNFDWKLSDTQIAAVLTYVRNSWGNTASPVAIKEVTKARVSLKAHRQGHPN